MQTTKTTVQTKPLIAAIALLCLAASAHAGLTQLADSPLSSASSVSISPNIMFVLDDSGSMNWDYLPDWAGAGNPPLSQRKNAGFNGIAYNPEISYLPPKYFNADGSVNATAYPSQTTANTASWATVKDDGYGVQYTTTSNLVGNAYYYSTVVGEYCTNKSLKTCVAASAPSTTYPEPARLRWCKTAAAAVAASPAAGDCQATQIEPNPAPPATATNIPFNYPRMPSPRISTISISGSSATSISNITVDGKKILSVAIASTSSAASMAASIEASVNACTFGLTGTCQAVGYNAVAAGSTVTISAPGAIGLTPVVTKSGSMSVTPTAFARPASNAAPGENLLTVITSGVTPSPVYPKTSKRADCAADPCTYAEEMTNFANWWAYYRTRMQSMKTATSRSFEPIGSNRRVGYMTINNNTSTDFQNIATFDAAQKKAWYDKVFSAVPNRNTPLRVALSNAGRLYAGQLNSSTFNGVAVVDPVQYYCQENVTILSTDGYWNEGMGFTEGGSLPVGDQDGPTVEEFPGQFVARPQLDGGSPQRQQYTVQNLKLLTPTEASWVQKKTEQLQSTASLVQTRTYTQEQERTSQLQSKTGQWQSQDWKLERRTYTQGQISTLTQLQEETAQLQGRSGPLQARTTHLQTRTRDQIKERTSQLQSQGGQIQSKTYQLQQRLTQVQKRTSSNGGTSWSGWSNVASCSPVSSGTNLAQCQTLAQSGWNDVSSCTAVAGGVTVANAGTDSAVTTYTTRSECQYNAPAWSNVSACTAITKSTGPNYTVAAPVDCQTVWSGTWTNASSCTTSSAQQCRYTSWTGYSNVASCVAAPQSGGPSYSVGTARECTTNNWTGWADTASTCVSSSTVGCRYNTAWTGWSNDSSCSPVSPSTGNPWNVIEQKQCRVNYGNWTNTTACTEITSGATQTQCQYLGWSGWSDVGSCVPAVPSSGPSYSGPARNCQTIWTTPVNALTACVPSVTTTCTTTWTPWADVPAPGGCTAVTGSSECRYRLAADWYNTASCTSAPRSSSSPYTVNQATDCRVIWPNSWVNATGTCTVAADTQCQYVGWSNWTNAGACTAQAQSAASPYAVVTARECRIDWTNWATTSACTPVAGATECNTTWPNPWISAASCDASNPSLQCRTQLLSDWGPPLPAAYNPSNPSAGLSSGVSCTAGTAGGLTTSCRSLVPNPSQPIPVATCTEDAASSTNAGVITSCPTPITTARVDVDTCTPAAATAANSYVATFCTEDATSGPTDDTLADVAEYYWKTDLRVSGSGVCTGGPIVTGGISSSTDVCVNEGSYPRQYMKTFTLGLGASGLMQYDKEYLTLTSGDYSSVATGVLADPANGVCSWQSFGACNWPKPESNKQTNIDDLWHAAVNGRGKYYSAGTPDDLATGISDALSSFDAKDGSLAAVTVSNANLTADDNSVFEISFKSAEWTGDIVKRTIDIATGELSADIKWPAANAAVKKSAKQLLEEKVSGGTHTARSIYTYNPGGTDNLKSFVWAELTTAQQNYFLKPHINTLSQFCTTGTTCLDPTTQDNTSHTVASGENLLKFIRGDKTHEGPPGTISTYYRQRTNLLGDIVGSEVAYVRKPPWSYADYKYYAFKTAQASRTAMIYVGANDGMLHAFDAETGNEDWAYIPAMLIPRLYKLADKSYAAPGRHEFFVDGTPVMGDICASGCASPAASTVWKTILVGGLNKGGRGYYALDITDPASPKALWEFTNDDLGYTFGNPVITKLKDGTWVVIVASGYNNVAPGDGEGRLFILNANTGSLIRTISTGVGDSSNPSGLAKISAWANFANSNNTTQRIYGGDLYGNLWRFDVNGDIPRTAPLAPGYVAQRLATLRDASNNGQPITTRPELGKVKNHPVVFIGTGQLLGPDDLATNQTQSFYAIKDRLTDADYGSPRPISPVVDSGFVRQTLTASTCPAGNPYCTQGQNTIVNSSPSSVDFNTNNGWYLDFPVAGERDNTDSRLVLKTLVFNTNTPRSGACVPIAVSHAYFLDYSTGGPVAGTDGVVGVRLGDFLSTAPSLIRLTDGTIRELVRTDSPSGTGTTGGSGGGGTGGSGTGGSGSGGGGTGTGGPGGGGTENLPTPIARDADGARRVSWRELITQ